MKNICLLSMLCCALFFSCQTAKNAAQEKLSLQHTWILTKGGKDVMGCNIQKPVSLTFSDKGVNGYSGCNSYFGPYKLAKKHTVKFGPLASTMMACLDNDCAKIEVGFIRDMDVVNHYKIEGGLLHLYQDNNLLLTFRKDK